MSLSAQMSPLYALFLEVLKFFRDFEIFGRLQTASLVLKGRQVGQNFGAPFEGRRVSRGKGDATGCPNRLDIHPAMHPNYLPN